MVRSIFLCIDLLHFEDVIIIQYRPLIILYKYHNNYDVLYIGDFGIVYRGLLTVEKNNIPQPVAVKTLKGIFIIAISL